MADTMPRFTGIGGIFFRTKNPSKTKEWYAENLGLAISEYGKFLPIIDPEGNKIELWEPIDSAFTEMGGPTTR